MAIVWKMIQTKKKGQNIDDQRFEIFSSPKSSYNHSKRERGWGKVRNKEKCIYFSLKFVLLFLETNSFFLKWLYLRIPRWGSKKLPCSVYVFLFKKHNSFGPHLSPLFTYFSILRTKTKVIKTTKGYCILPILAKSLFKRCKSTRGDPSKKDKFEGKTKKEKNARQRKNNNDIKIFLPKTKDCHPKGPKLKRLNENNDFWRKNGRTIECKIWDKRNEISNKIRIKHT